MTTVLAALDVSTIEAAVISLAVAGLAIVGIRIAFRLTKKAGNEISV